MSMIGYLSTILLLACALLSGCQTHPKVLDQRTGAVLNGPISFGISRNPVSGICRSGAYYFGGTCDLIFSDLNGRDVDGFRLSRDLDEAGKRIKPLLDWYSKNQEESKLPYDLFLLTISPAVVLAVPTDSSSRLRCGTVYQEGCIQSQGFRAKAYWYRMDPPIREGSFWYTTMSQNPVYLDIRSGSTRIVTNDAVLELNPVGTSYSIRRIK